MAKMSRYIVTYHSKKINPRKAAEILHRPAEAIRPIEPILGPGIPQKEDAVYHFNVFLAVA